MVAESMVRYCWIAQWHRSARAPNAISNVQNRTVELRSTRFVKSSSNRHPRSLLTALARIDSGSRHHGGCRREFDYCADERTECRKPVTCLHPNYLKHSETGISERSEIFPARDLAKTGSRARSCH